MHKNIDERRRYGRKWYKKNKNKILERHHKYRERKKIENRTEYLLDCRKHNLKTLYGITTEQYNEMLSKQDSRCAICGIYQNQLDRALCVDHNHNNGEVRGLLCDKCNNGIGRFNDSIDLISRALEYLKNRQR